MQPFNPRPSLQPIQRPTGQFTPPARGLQVPDRMHLATTIHQEAGTNIPPKYRESTPAAPPASPYANSTAALFGEAPQPSYTPGLVSRKPRHSFPFRALMVALIIVAAAAGVYAGIRVFSNPDPVNAGDKINSATP